jgi:ankyrin repeat protein
LATYFILGPLSSAAEQGELKAIEIIIKKVTEIDDEDTQGRTALHVAAYMGHTDVVAFLVRERASLSKTDHHKRTALFWALLGNAEETARFLLDKMIESGATIDEINTPTKKGRTVLRQASFNGFAEIVKMILDKVESPAVINAVDNRKGRSALHCAALRGKAEVIELLLKKGADSSIKDGDGVDGKTALQLCHEQWVFQGTKDFEKTIALLIDNDLVAAAQDSRLASTAAINGSRVILEKLHKAHMDLCQLDQYGWSPLLLAKQFQHTDAEEFLSRQAKPTKWNNDLNIYKVTEDGRGIEHAGEGDNSPSSIYLEHLD